MTKKEARKILKTHPHKWYYNKFGPDLICGVCDSNMEGMQYKGRLVDLSVLNKESKAKLLKKVHKYGPELFKYEKTKDGKEYAIVPEWYFREKHILTEDSKDFEKYEYVYPEESIEVDCPCCKDLHEVFSHCWKAFPLYIRFRWNLSNFLQDLHPYVIVNRIGKKFGVFSWEKNGGRKWPTLFDNKKAITNYSTAEPKTWAECLVYGWDAKLQRNSYLIAYWYPDTKKFYIGTDCLKENDLKTKWSFDITHWAVLRYMKEDDFGHRSE